jgi:hypothetical protein
MTIILDLNSDGSAEVTDYNGCSSLLRTDDLRQAIKRTRREAIHFEAIVRLRIRRHGRLFELVTNPVHLRSKIYAVRLALFLFGRAALQYAE